MNIHEYQAKHLFQNYGIPTQKGYIAQKDAEVDTALDRLSDGPIVVKAQIHAGGRGKGRFMKSNVGGVTVVDTKAAARKIATQMLGDTLVTHQTGPQGRNVQTIYLTEACTIEREYYLAIVMDREAARPTIIASTEGGVDIETVAAEHPDKILQIVIDPGLGLRPYQARHVAWRLGLQGIHIKQCTEILQGLYQLFWEKDSSLVEINPLIITAEGDLKALDAKVAFDDNALFRHQNIQDMRDLNEEDPKEIQASRAHLSYIALDGDIACMVNGAGLAMATMDIIKHYGGAPANFLDVGGGANEEQVTTAFKIILSDPNVNGILINIFGGIMKCDIVAKGIMNAAKNLKVAVPIVIRLEGTHVNEGKQILNESGLTLTTATSLDDAARKIVEIAATSQ